MAAKRLRVRIGPSFDKDSQRTITVNDESNPVRIESEHFSGFVWFRVHKFKGVSSPLPSASSPLATAPEETEPVIPDSKYFEGKRRFFSLEFRGRFKKSWTANDIEFGIVLARKIRLPVGADIGLRIAQVGFFPSLYSLMVERN